MTPSVKPPMRLLAFNEDMAIAMLRIYVPQENPMSDDITHKTCHVCGVNLRSLPDAERSLLFVDIGGVPDVGLCGVCKHEQFAIGEAWSTADNNVDDNKLREMLRDRWREYGVRANIDVTFGNEA